MRTVRASELRDGRGAGGRKGRADERIDGRTSDRGWRTYNRTGGRADRRTNGPSLRKCVCVVCVCTVSVCVCVCVCCVCACVRACSNVSVSVFIPIIRVIFIVTVCVCLCSRCTTQDEIWLICLAYLVFHIIQTICIGA